MDMKLKMLARGLAALALAGALSLGAAQAQQPATGLMKPPSGQEEQMLRELKKVEGRVSIPDAKSGTLIQPAGQEFRAFHRDTLPWIGAAAIFGMALLLALFFFVRGRIRVAAGLSGHTMLRFPSFDRMVHWMTAACFIILALSGLNMAFGRTLLLPLIGDTGFSALTQLGKTAHNYLGFPFMLGVALMFLIWVSQNIPNARDIAWFRAGGGIVGKGHPPAGKFNGGQKIIFWTVVLGGTALSVTGLMLLMPFDYTDIAGMQLSQTTHGLIGVVMMAVILAHIYIGTLGMEGAFSAMGSGEVDVNWAREHHSVWYEQEAARGRAAAE